MRSGTDDQKTYASTKLSGLVNTHATHSMIAEADGIAPLLALLTGGNRSARLQALFVLDKLTKNEEIKPLIVQAGGHALLVSTVINADTLTEVQCAATPVNRLVDTKEDGELVVAEASGLERFLSHLIDGTDEQKQVAIPALANLWYIDLNTQFLMDKAVVSLLVALVREGWAAHSRPAARALNTLASKDDQSKALIAAASDMSSHVSLLVDGSNDTQRQQALICMERLASVEINAQAIVEANAIASLISIVLHGSDLDFKHAASALNHIARQAQHRPLIAQASGIEPLVALVIDSTDATQRQQATASLNRLACVDYNQKVITEASGLNKLVSLVGSGRYDEKECAARTLGRLAVLGDNRQAIVDAGGIAPLVALILDGTDAQRTHAANAINTVASLYRVRTRIPEESGIPQLVALVIEGSDTQRERAAFSLDRLALVHLNKTLIATASCIQNLISNVRQGNAAQQQQALPLMANIACITHNRTLITKSGAIPSLVALALAQKASEATRANAVQVLAVLALSEESHQPITAANGIAVFVKLLRDTGRTDCHKSAVLGL